LTRIKCVSRDSAASTYDPGVQAVFRPGHAFVNGNGPFDHALVVSFHQVVHPVLSEEAEVATLQRFLGGPDEHP
jgi:hypothetical protein